MKKDKDAHASLIKNWAEMMKAPPEKRLETYLIAKNADDEWEIEPAYSFDRPYLQATYGMDDEKVNKILAADETELIALLQHGYRNPLPTSEDYDVFVRAEQFGPLDHTAAAFVVASATGVPAELQTGEHTFWHTLVPNEMFPGIQKDVYLRGEPKKPREAYLEAGKVSGKNFTWTLFLMREESSNEEAAASKE